MKIVIVPDNHLNKNVYSGVKDKKIPSLPFRNVDFMNSFEYIVDKCIQELHPDLFIIPGDVYDHPSPSNEVRGFFSSQLCKLSEAKIPVIILLGNHDVFKKNHALEDIHKLGLKNVKVIERPQIKMFRGFRLLLFPYSMDVEQKIVTMKEEFNNFIEEIEKNDSEAESLFFGHFGVKDAIMNEYSISSDLATDTTTTLPPEVEKKKFVNRNPNDITAKDLDRIGASYVFLGDFHRFQVLNTKKCIALYPGSIEKTDFNEIDQKKGFVLFDTEAEPEDNMGKCRFIEYPNCRPMIQLKGDFEKIKSDFAKVDYSKHQEAMVKISFIGTSEELGTFSTEIESFKKEIRKAVNPIHIISGQKIKDDKQDEEASRLEQQILEKGHMQAEDVIEVVKEIIIERVVDEKERQAIIDLGIEIYKENME